MNRVTSNNNPTISTTAGFALNLRGRQLDCSPGLADGAHVAGILNVTPDSFYDGGDFLDYGSAMRRAEQIILEGAAIIDIGGASSRPRGAAYGEGSDALSPEDEWGRIRLVVKGIAREFPDTIVSVDTFQKEVAELALEAGAHLINDITGLRHSPGIASAVAAAEAGLIVMHSIGMPGSMPHEHQYEDVVSEVRNELLASCRIARDAGVKSIVTDPGFGFGKSSSDNLRLIAETDAFLELGVPVMIGVSRKSAIGATLGTTENPLPTSDRLYGSLGATAVAVIKGATLVRTHDVRETVEMLKLIGESLATKVS